MDVHVAALFLVLAIVATLVSVYAAVAAARERVQAVAVAAVERAEKLEARVYPTHGVLVLGVYNRGSVPAALERIELRGVLGGEAFNWTGGRGVVLEPGRRLLLVIPWSRLVPSNTSGGAEVAGVVVTKHNVYSIGQGWVRGEAVLAVDANNVGQRVETVFGASNHTVKATPLTGAFCGLVSLSSWGRVPTMDQFVVTVYRAGDGVVTVRRFTGWPPNSDTRDIDDVGLTLELDNRSHVWRCTYNGVFPLGYTLVLAVFQGFQVESDVPWTVTGYWSDLTNESSGAGGEVFLKTLPVVGNWPEDFYEPEVFLVGGRDAGGVTRGVVLFGRVYTSVTYTLEAPEPQVPWAVVLSEVGGGVVG